MTEQVPVQQQSVEGRAAAAALVALAQRRAAIAADYEGGLSTTECARRHGLSQTRVRQILTREGVRMRPVGVHCRDKAGTGTPDAGPATATAVVRTAAGSGVEVGRDG